MRTRLEQYLPARPKDSQSSSPTLYLLIAHERPFPGSKCSRWRCIEKVMKRRRHTCYSARLNKSIFDHRYRQSVCICASNRLRARDRKTRQRVPALTQIHKCMARGNRSPRHRSSSQELQAARSRHRWHQVATDQPSTMRMAEGIRRKRQSLDIVSKPPCLRQMPSAHTHLCRRSTPAR